jgi:hypothetical protein
MKTLGLIMERFLSQIIFRIILVLFIVLTALKIIGVTLGESISGASERKRVQLEDLNRSLIGKSITDPVQNSKMILRNTEKISSEDS